MVEGVEEAEELLALRNDNAHRERRFYGASADREIVKEPVYDVKVLLSAAATMRASISGQNSNSKSSESANPPLMSPSCRWPRFQSGSGKAVSCGEEKCVPPL